MGEREIRLRDVERRGERREGEIRLRDIERRGERRERERSG